MVVATMQAKRQELVEVVAGAIVGSPAGVAAASNAGSGRPGEISGAGNGSRPATVTGADNGVK